MPLHYESTLAAQREPGDFSEYLRKINLGFFLTLIAVCVATLSTGEISLPEIWEGLVQNPEQWNALRDERLPRLIVLILTGASLATAGAVMQSMFQNPLASPSVLGITPGGSLMVMSTMILGLHVQYPVIWPLAAVGGCFGTLLLVYGIAKRNGPIQMQQLILTGIAISTLIITIQGVLMYVFRDRWQLIVTIAEWEAGSTYNRSWQHVHMQLPLAIVGLIGCWLYRGKLDLLALGEEEALNLGVDVRVVRWRLFLSVALLTGGAIAAVGMIAFFGLALPHLLRTIAGPRNEKLIPLCIVGGASILPALDYLLRFSGVHVMTIGNISSLVGGIFFLILLFGSRRRWQTC